MTSPSEEAGWRTGRWPALDYVLGTASILLLIGLTLLTCVDVVGRYGFNAPVNGAFELTQMMLAALIFAALPMTTAAGQHVEVEVLTSAMGSRGNRYLAALGQLVTAVVLFALCWRLWVYADRLAHDGAVTNSLALSLAPIGYLAALSCALSGLIALLLSFNRR